MRLFGEGTKPQPRPLATEEQAELQALLARRDQLLEMRTAEMNRKSRARGRVQKSVKETLEFLERQLRMLDSDIDSRIQQSPLWKEKESILRSVPGVGPQVARVLLASFPELGTATEKEVAAIAGVAPFARDSGTLRGVRTIWGGRARVRSALYMTSLSASRHNPPIRALYTRLREKGKPRKVALVACMRKLLVILNAMLRNRQSWNLSLAPA